MFLKQQVCGSHGASGAGAWQTGKSRTADALIPLCVGTHTHSEPFLSQRSAFLHHCSWQIRGAVPTKGWVLKAVLVLVGDALPRLPTGTTRTKLWQNRGALGVCHDPGSDSPCNTKWIITASIYRTDPTWGCSWPHQGTVRAGSPSLCPWCGPGVLMLAHLPDVALQKVRQHSRMETSALYKDCVSEIVTEGMPGWIFTSGINGEA